MREAGKLTIISIVAGIVLAGFLKVVQQLTGNKAYVLLFNVDYVPLLKYVSHLSYCTNSFSLRYLYCQCTCTLLY